MREVNRCVNQNSQNNSGSRGCCHTQVLNLADRVARLEGQVQIITVLLGYLAVLATAAVGYLLRMGKV